MASVTAQNIPPELQIAASRVMTPKKNKSGTTTNAAGRKGTKRPKKPKKTSPAKTDLKAAAIYVAQLMRPDRSERQNAELARKLQQDYSKGIFDEVYWTDCIVESETTLQSSPTSVPDGNPPPYAYRTPDNMPTIPTYPNGQPSGGTPTYTGQTNGTHFEDVSLSWKRIVFRLDAPRLAGQEIFAFVVIAGTMQVQASHRGSKPMLSAITSGAICASDDAALETTEPPVAGITVNAPSAQKGSQSHYWRYKLPKTNPPYFSLTRLRPIVRELERMATRSATGKQTRAVICIAPRPMLGRGYNNNTSVETSFQPSVKLYACAKIFSFTALTARTFIDQNTTRIVIASAADTEARTRCSYYVWGGNEGHDNSHGTSVFLTQGKEVLIYDMTITLEGQGARFKGMASQGGIAGHKRERSIEWDMLEMDVAITIDDYFREVDRYKMLMDASGAITKTYMGKTMVSLYQDNITYLQAGFYVTTGD